MLWVIAVYAPAALGIALDFADPNLLALGAKAHRGISALIRIAHDETAQELVREAGFAQGSLQVGFRGASEVGVILETLANVFEKIVGVRVVCTHELCRSFRFASSCTPIVPPGRIAGEIEAWFVVRVVPVTAWPYRERKGYKEPRDSDPLWGAARFGRGGALVGCGDCIERSRYARA
jgi:hypothetical protein